MQDNFLHQLVREPTRGDNILDLVLSNSENLVKEVSVDDCLGNSDHKVITFQLEIKAVRSDNLMRVPNFRRANFEDFRKYLEEIDWTSTSGNGDNPHHEGVEELYNNFTIKLHTGQKRFIPSKKFRSGKNEPNWMNNRIKFLLGRKNGMYKKIKRGDNVQLNQFPALKRQIKREIRSAKRNLEVRTAREAKSNPKAFYQLYQTKAREKIGPLKDGEGEMVTDNAKMAELLNLQFASVFTEENLRDVPPAPDMFRNNDEDKLR